MNPRHVYADFKVFSRGYLRNSAALFFSLVFPIILIGIFGLIYSGGSTNTTLYAENLDGNSNASVAFLSALNSTGVVSVQVVSPSVGGGDLGTYLGDNYDPVGIVIPSGFAADYAGHRPVSVVLYQNPQDPTSVVTAESAINAVVTAFNLNAANGTAFVSLATAKVGSQLFNGIDYLVPGLIGFAILTSPMFSMVEISSSYKKDHLFRQLALTPLTKAEWLLSKILWYIVITLISAGIMISIGYFAFHARLDVGWTLLPFLVLGPFFFVALGMLCGSVTKTPETAAVVGNIVTFPMMFLSGTFFPVSDFPPGLQTFAHFLPLYYIIDGMNQVLLFGNLSRAFFDLALILVGAIVIFAAAVSVFKWRES